MPGSHLGRRVAARGDACSCGASSWRKRPIFWLVCGPIAGSCMGPYGTASMPVVKKTLPPGLGHVPRKGGSVSAAVSALSACVGSRTVRKRLALPAGAHHTAWTLDRGSDVNKSLGQHRAAHGHVLEKGGGGRTYCGLGLRRIYRRRAEVDNGNDATFRGYRKLRIVRFSRSAILRFRSSRAIAVPDAEIGSATTDGCYRARRNCGSHAGSGTRAFAEFHGLHALHDFAIVDLSAFISFAKGPDIYVRCEKITHGSAQTPVRIASLA